VINLPQQLMVAKDAKAGGGMLDSAMLVGQAEED
jgi:hypothetical protein